MRKASPRLVLMVLGAGLLGAALWWHFHDSSGEKNAKKGEKGGPIPVVTVKVAPQDVPSYLNGIGTVTSLQQVVVRTRVDGELLRLNFREGQDVRKGQLLAEIDPRPIQATLDQAHSEEARTEAQLKLAELDLERYQRLQKEDAIAGQTVDQQVAQVAQLKAGLASARATVAAASVQLDYTRITSPLTGRVGIRRVDPGNIVHASDADGIVTVTQMDPIAVLFTLPQENLTTLVALMHEDKSAELDVLEKEGGKLLASGTLGTLDNQVDQATGTIRLRAMVPNGTHVLWPGQFVVVRLHAYTFRHALTLPVVALQRRQSGPYVWRVANGKAEAVPVEVSFENDTIAVIGKGLAEGDVVVVDGQSRLKPEASVTLVTDEAKPAAPLSPRP